eukprot:gene8203-31_t
MSEPDFSIPGSNDSSSSLSRLSAPKFDSFAVLPTVENTSSESLIKERTSSFTTNPFSGTSSMIEMEGIQDTLKEQGVRVPTALTFLRQFQTETSKFLSEKFLILDKDGDLKDYDFILNYRRTESYLKYMQVFSEMSKSCASTLSQMLLSWFPGGQQDVSSKKNTKKKKTAITKKPKTTDSQFIAASKEPVPLKWCYASWTDSTVNFDSKKVLHHDIAEFFALLVVADLFCVVLQHKPVLDHNTFNLIFNNSMELFYDIPLRQYGVWAKYNELLLHQWSFVIRRLSSIDPKKVVEHVKNKVPSAKSSVSEPDAMSVLKAVRYFYVDMADKKMDFNTMLVLHLIELLEYYKKSNPVRESVMEILENFYSQLDFQNEQRTGLFENEAKKIYTLIGGWLKSSSGNFKKRIQCLQAKIVSHSSMSFFESTAMDLLTKTLSNYRKTSHIAGLVDAISIIFEDKINPVTRLYFGFSNTGTSETLSKVLYKEEREFFGDVFLYEIKDLKSGTPEYIEGLTKKKYLGFLEDLLKIAKKEMFDQKKPAVVQSKEPASEVFNAYVQFILRVVAFSHENGYAILSSLLTPEKSKTPEHYYIALSAVSLIIRASDTSCPELLSIAHHPNYQKDLEDFLIKNSPNILTILQKECEDVIGYSQLGLAPSNLPVFTYLQKLQPLDAEESDDEEESLQIDARSSSVDLQLSAEKLELEPSEGDVGDEDEDTEANSISFTNIEAEDLAKLNKKEEAVKTKKLQSASKAKTQYPLNLALYRVGISILPHIDAQNIIKTNEFKKFIGTRLVYNDGAVARNTSNSLQEIVHKNKFLRVFVLEGVASMLEEPAYQEENTMVTLIDNLTLFVSLWAKSIEDDKTACSNDKEKLKTFLESCKNEDSMVLQKLESLMLISLCHFDKKLRSSAILLLKAISDLEASKTDSRIEGFKTAKQTVYAVIEKKTHHILSRANYLNILKQLRGDKVEHTISIGEISFMDASQKENEFLWGFVLQELIKVILNNNLEGIVKQTLKGIDKRCQLLQPLETVKKGTVDDSFAIKWTNFIIYKMSGSGFSETYWASKVTDTDIKEKQEETTKYVNSIIKALKSDLTWIKRTIITGLAAVHPQNIHVVLKALHSYCTGKNKQKDMFVVISKILLRMTQHYEFRTAFVQTGPDTEGVVKENISSFSNIIKLFIGMINEIQYPRIKSVQLIEKYQYSEIEFCVSIKNFAIALDQSYCVETSTNWSQNDRLAVVIFLQIISDLSDKYPSRKMGQSTIPKNTSIDLVTKVYTELTAKRQEVAYDAIAPILKIGTIYGDKDDALAQLQWYEEPEVEGRKLLTYLLYHHMDFYMEYFLQRIYAETREELFVCYYNSVCNLFNPRVTYNVCHCDVVQDMVDQIKYPLHSVLPPNVSRFHITLLHFGLYGLSHGNVEIHSNAFNLLKFLAHRGFDTPLPTDAEDELFEIEKRDKVTSILETFRSPMRTFSEYALNVYLEQVSFALSQAFSSFTSKLFDEYLMTFDQIRPNKRKMWVLRALKPWAKHLPIVSDNLSKLFRITQDISIEFGFTEDMKTLWQDLALSPKSKQNFPKIVGFLKRHCRTEKSTQISHEILLSLYNARPKETIELVISDLSFQKLDRNSFPDHEELLLHQEIVKGIIQFLSLLLSETQVVQPLIENLPYIFVYALVTFELYPKQMRVLLNNILLKATPETTKISHFFETQAFKLNFHRNKGNLKEKVVDELNKSKIVDSEILVSHIDDTITTHELITVFSTHFEKNFSSESVEKIGEVALSGAADSRNPEVIFQLISIFSSVLKPVDQQGVKEIIKCMYNSSRYLEQSKSFKKVKQTIDQEYKDHMVQYLTILKSLAEVHVQKNDLEPCFVIFWTSMMFLGSSVNEIYVAALDCLRSFINNESLKQIFFTKKIEESLKTYAVKFRPEFHGIQLLLLKSLLKQETEEIGIELLLKFMEIEYDDIIESAETRHLTAVSLVLPYLYRESQNEVSYTLLSKICSTFFSTLNNSLGECIGKFEELKSHPNQYMKNVCSELAKQYFPKHASNCSDILYAISFGPIQNASFIFKLTNYFLELSDSKSYLNEFMSITRLSCNIAKFQIENTACLISNSFKLSHERNDGSVVNQKTKVLAYHMNSIKPSTEVEIELSLKNVFDIYKKKMEKREVVPLKQEFDFKGVKIIDTTIAPNSRPYLMIKPYLDKHGSSKDGIIIPKLDVEIVDVLPSEIKKQKENEELKKNKEIEEKIKAESKQKEREEKQAVQQENAYAISCLQKFSLKWREQARSVVLHAAFTEEDDLIDDLVNDTESCDLLENFAKDQKIDILFYRSVLDFKDELGMTESLIAAKEIIESFVKNSTFDLSESSRNNVLSEYARNQSNPSKDTFKAAMKQVKERLEKNVLPEFLKSDEYKNYEKKLNSKKKFGKK